MGLCIHRGNPHFNFLILEQFSASRSLDCTLCLLVLCTSMSGHNAISIVLLMRFLYLCRMFQMEIASGSTAPALALPCQASADSILDYGQYMILSTGNFLCSLPTVNSIMDFSVKPIEEGVVDSPPNSKLRLPICAHHHHCARWIAVLRQCCQVLARKGRRGTCMERNLFQLQPQ